MPQLIDLGRIRLQFLGTYSNTTVHKVNDVVRYGGNLYVYKNATNAAAILPTTTTHWSLMLEGFNFRGPWDVTATYIVGDIVNYGGLLYNAIGHSIGVQPDDDATKWEKFLEGFSWEGEWSSTTAYQEGDVVRNGGNLFIAKRDTTGDLPGDAATAADWDLFAPGTNPRGAYDETEEYFLNDLVTVGSRTYRALEHVSAGDRPDDTYTAPATNPWVLQNVGLSYRGNWVTGTDYEIDDLVRHGGQTYIVKLRHESPADFVDSVDDGDVEIFTAGTRWRGTWATAQVYLIGDLAFDGVTTYIATADHTAGATFAGDLAYWDVYSQGADYLPAQNTNENKVLTTDGTDPSWTDEVNLEGQTQAMGPGAFSFVSEDSGLTNPALVVQFDDGQTDKESFAQIAFRHKDPTSSTDIIAYSSDGTDSAGWVGMGITGKDFGDPNFTLTGGNTAYIFYEAEVDAAAEGGTGNLVFATGDKGTDNSIVFAAGGFASGTEQMTIIPDERVHIEIDTASTSSSTGALTVSGGVGIQGNLNIQGDLNVEGNFDLSGLDFIAVGDGANTFAATLTNPIAVFQADTDDFAQIAFRNVGDEGNSSTDFLAYADIGTDASGWIDMGITSAAFDDPEFTITGGHDGYIFMEAPAGTSGDGNLVIATGSNGAENKIIFGAGGLSDNSVQMTITPFQNVHIEIDTESTSPSTGALTVVGGVGIQGNLNVQGDTDIVGNVNIQGQITVAGEGTTFETNNLAVSDPMIYVASPNPANVLDFAFVGEAAFAITPLVRNLSLRAVATNVATVTTSAAHGFQPGDFVTIAGSIAALNGQHLITATPETDEFTFAVVTADFAETGTTGTATVSARAKYSGLVKDATDAKWKLFKDLDTKPTQTVDFGDAALDTLLVDGLEATNIDASSSIQVNGSDVIAESIANAKGDIIVATAADDMSTLTVGSNDTFLQADSAAATGLKYTNLATGSVLGAVLTNSAANTTAAATALSTSTVGQASYSTATKNLTFKTSTGVHEVGPVFLGFSINYSTGEMTANVGTDDAVYDCGTFVEHALLPATMAPSVTSSGILQLA